MNDISLLQRIRNVSITKKLYFVIGTMALLIAAELFILFFTMHTLSATRALVGAEGLWSKAQKDATYYLQKYGLTGKQQDYMEYLHFLKVQIGDSKTRLELMKADPDLAIARQGFIEGRVHPDDIDGTIKLLLRFSNISYIKEAINYWTEGDLLMAQLKNQGALLHKQVLALTEPKASINQTLDEIDKLNRQLTILEDKFSYTLGEGSRWLENLILKMLFLIAVTVEFTGLFLTISVSIGISKGINEIVHTSSRVADSDFSVRAKKFSEDEIGILADSFNRMIGSLEKKVAQQRVVDEKLNEQRDLYETLLNAQSEMGEGVSLSVGEKTVYANEAMCKMNGYSQEEFINMPSLFDLVVEEEKPRLRERMRDRLAGKSFPTNTGETKLITKGGEVIDVEYSFSTVNIEGVPHSVSIIRDITARKHSEYLLKSSEEKFLRVFQSNPVAISISRISDNTFIDVNESFLETMQYEREEVIGRSALEIGIIKDTAYFEKIFEKLDEQGYVKNMPGQFYTKSGSVNQALISVESLEIAHEKCIVVTTHDITELLLAKEAIELQAKELVRSNADLEQFAYVSSHDLQEPLRTVVSYLQLIEKRYKNKLDKEGDEFIGFAINGAKRMHVLINDLLTYSRIGTNNIPFKKVNCRKVMDIVLNNLDDIIHKYKAMIILDTSMPTITADELQITQLFQNLIENGIKYSREGVIPEIRIAVHKKNKDRVFSFSDNGIGIAKEYAERIFVIFQRLHTREKYAGTGIGLALCKKIVEKHGGKIWVEPGLKSGSVFYFTIPEVAET